MIRRRFIFAAAILLPVLAHAAGFDAAIATNQLGLDLYRQLAASSPEGNLVLSPYSIDSALALAYAGADGATRSEMAGVLHFPADDASVQVSLGALRATLDALGETRDDDGKPSIEWHQANRLFGQQGYEFRPSYLDLMKNGYGAPFEPLDFQTKTETARNFINDWVAEQTRQKIRNLIPQGGLNARTRLVLVNALYLKAPWLKPFKKRDTHPEPFHVSGAGATDVTTMQRTAPLGYAKEDGFTVVALDYLAGDLQFLILLPDQGIDSNALAAKLTTEQFQKWAKLGEKTTALVELHLPKFRIDGPTRSLGLALQTLGLNRAFDQPRGSADFSRMAPRQANDYLALSEIFHRTFIAVDEEGAEAAAATGVVMLAAFGVEVAVTPTVVRVDRPFLFAIQHRLSGACLFLGRITDPR